MSSVETGQMSAVETGQMSAAETGQMSAVETRQMLKSQIRGRAQNHQNGPKWVQNGRQASRIGPNESNHGSKAFPTRPRAKNIPKKGRNLEIGRSGPPLLGSTAQDLPPTVASRFKADIAIWNLCCSAGCWNPDLLALTLEFRLELNNQCLTTS